MMKFIFTFFSLWILLISKSFASSSTYLCDLAKSTDVIWNGKSGEYIIDDIDSSFIKQFMLKKFDDYVILKRMANGKKQN